MSRKSPTPSANDAWHFLDEFRDLVARSSNAVMAARRAEHHATGASGSESTRARWAAATLWARAATDETALARSLHESGRGLDSLQTYLYATQYALSSGDPMRARGLLDELDRLPVPGRPEMPDSWKRDREMLERSTREASDAWHAFQVKGHELRKSGGGAGDQRIELETAIARDFPGSGHCFYHLAVLHHERGDAAQALEMIRHACAFLPTDPRVAILAGHLLLDAGYAAESLGILHRQLREVPEHPLHRIPLALALARHWERAPADRSLLTQVLRLLPAEASLSAFSPKTRTVAGLLRCAALWNTGRREEADELREWLRRIADTESYVPEFLDNPVESWDLADLLRSTERSLPEAA